MQPEESELGSVAVTAAYDNTDYITPHQLVTQLKNRVQRRSAAANQPGYLFTESIPASEGINQQSSADYPTSSRADTSHCVWPFHQSDRDSISGEVLQAVTTAAPNADACTTAGMARNNHITHHNNFKPAAKLNVRGTDYNILANSTPLTNGFFLSDNISSQQSNHPVGGNKFSSNPDIQRSQHFENFPQFADHQASLNIIPITVHNKNTNQQPAATESKLAWHGNGIVTEVPNHILQLADRKPLTTGNRIPNYYDVRNDIKNSHHNSERSIPNNQLGLSVNNTDFGSAECVSSRDKDKLASMASYGTAEGYPSQLNSKVRVKPIGNDSFMLSVEDTGVHPQRLQQQMIDRAASQPMSPPAWGTNQWTSGRSNPNFFFAPHEHLNASAGGRMENPPVANSFGAQPFMVTWSENGLPRINMMSTPWLSNTLSRQKNETQPARVSTPPLEMTTPHQNVSGFTPARMETQPHSQVSDSRDIPVYKIVGNEWQQMDNRPDNNPPPPPPPRAAKNVTPGGLSNFGTMPRHNSRHQDRHDINFPPSFPQAPPSSNRAMPTGTYMTMPSQQHKLDSVDSYRPARLYHPAEATLPRSRGNMVRINAPKPIDVTQVPAAGRQNHLPPQTRPSFTVESPSPTSPPELPPRHTPTVTQEIDIPVILRPSGPTDQSMQSDKTRAESPTHTSVKHHNQARSDDWAKSPYITVKQDRPRQDQTPYITVKRDQPNHDSHVSVTRVDQGGDVPSFKLTSSSTAASPVPRFHDTLPRPVRDQSGHVRLAPAVHDEEAPPRPKSPSGYLQTFLREYKRRSPSPARKTLPSSSRERGRDPDRARSRSSERPSRRQRDGRSDRRLRSPSPMPQKSREIVFSDEIDWSDEGRGRPSQTVDWDQIEAVMT